MNLDLNLVIPSFIAGFLTFLAPCTLPLVPGYLGFISGVSLEDLKNPGEKKVKLKILLNSVLYVLGFSLVFIVLGSLFGLGGASLIQYRIWLARLGGIFIIIFGLFILDAFKLPFLNFLDGEKKFLPTKIFKPGRPFSSFIFGSTFAFGWTPCVGPILASVLILASTSATVLQGAFLLAIFSLGLAIPFLLIALFVGQIAEKMNKINRYLNIISKIGGAFLIFIGVLILTNKFAVWISYLLKLFSFINYDQLLERL